MRELCLFLAVVGSVSAATIGTSASFLPGCPEVPTITSSGTERAFVSGACDERPEFPGVYQFTYDVSSDAAPGDLSVNSAIYSSRSEVGGTTASAWYEDVLTVTTQGDREVFLSYDVVFTGRHSYFPFGWSTPAVKFGGAGANLAQLFMERWYGEGFLVSLDDPTAVQTNRGFLFRGELNLQTQGYYPQASVRVQLVGIRAKDGQGNEVPITVTWGAGEAQGRALQLNDSEMVHTPEPSTWVLLLAGVTALLSRRLYEWRGLGWSRATARLRSKLLTP